MRGYCLTSFGHPKLVLICLSLTYSGMLNEECQLNRDVDNVRLAQRIDDLKNPVLKRVAMTPPASNHPSRRQQDPHLLKREAEEAFAVKHYAGTVNYSLSNMIEKNRDKVAQDLVDLVDESENGFLKDLFADWENPNSLRGGLALAGFRFKFVAFVCSSVCLVFNTKYHKKLMKNSLPKIIRAGKICFACPFSLGESRRQTLLSKFKTSLDSLMQHLRATTPHYIRCVKPSPLNPGCFTGPNAVHLKDGVSMFDAATVEQQLRATGILETVAISKQLCPVRLTFHEFLHRYELLLPRSSIDHNNIAPEMPDLIPGESNGRGMLVSTPKALASRSSQAKTLNARQKAKKRRMTFEGIEMPTKKSVVVSRNGDSKRGQAAVHLTPTAVATDEDDEQRLRRDRVSSIMAAVFENNNFMLGKSKIFLTETQFQALEKRRSKQMNEKAFVIQCAWRRYRRERRLESALLIQSVFRGYWQRRQFTKTKATILKIQSVYRGMIVRQRVAEQRRAAGVIVRFFRGLTGRKEFLKKRAAVLVIQDGFRRWKMRKLQQQLAASRRHSAAKSQRVTKSRASNSSSSSSRTSIGFATPPSSMDGRNRSFDADATFSSNRSLYFTPDCGTEGKRDAGRETSRRKSSGIHERGAGDGSSLGRTSGGPSASKTFLEFPPSPYVTTRRKPKNRDASLREDDETDDVTDEFLIQSFVNDELSKHQPDTAKGASHTAYPDLLRSLTSHKSPPKNPQSKPVIPPSPPVSSANLRSSSSSRPSPGNRISLNGSGDGVTYAHRDDVAASWRFRPLDELQKREKRRGSMVFNQKGCVKELPEVPYVEISARGNIVSRRRLTRVPIRFHLTTGEILTNAHVLPWQELTCSITDCLPAYDHVYCNKRHCAAEHVRE